MNVRLGLGILASVATLLAPTAAKADQVETRLSAGAAVFAEIWQECCGVNGGVRRVMSAKLVDGAGSPIADRAVTFYVDGDPVCSSQTSSLGIASCGENTGDYVARFFGDEQYAPSSSVGYLVSADGPVSARVWGGGVLFDVWVD